MVHGSHCFLSAKNGQKGVEDNEISAFKQECMTEHIIFVSYGLHVFFFPVFFVGDFRWFCRLVWRFCRLVGSLRLRVVERVYLLVSWCARFIFCTGWCMQCMLI